MENLELYLENENGQMVFNWEALELITDEKFVSELKLFVEIHFGDVFKVEKGLMFTRVYIKTPHAFKVYRYDRLEKEYSSILITKGELDILNNYKYCEGEEL